MATLLFLRLSAIQLRYGSLFSVSWSRILHVAVLIIVVALLYFYHSDITMSMLLTIPSWYAYVFLLSSLTLGQCEY